MDLFSLFKHYYGTLLKTSDLLHAPKTYLNHFYILNYNSFDKYDSDTWYEITIFLINRNAKNCKCKRKQFPLSTDLC